MSAFRVYRACNANAHTLQDRNLRHREAEWLRAGRRTFHSWFQNLPRYPRHHAWVCTLYSGLMSASKCLDTHLHLFFFFFFAALGLCCCTLAFSSCGEGELLLVAVCGLLIAVASLVVARGLSGVGSVVVVHGLSCSAACGIFLDQGSNLRSLHWQEDS